MLRQDVGIHKIPPDDAFLDGVDYSVSAPLTTESSLGRKTRFRRIPRQIQASSRVDDPRAAQGHRGPGCRHRADPLGDLHRGPLPACRRSRTGQDARREHDRQDSRCRVSANSIHARFDALRHHRHKRSGGNGHRTARVPLRPGTCLHQHSVGRRNQPHAAQDAGGLASGHAGTRGHDRADDLQFARTVLCDRDAEPH